MLIVHVHVQVKPEAVEAFREATVENARNSLKESGIARFDVLQKPDDPAPGIRRRPITRFGATQWLR
jgi:autoinducer 2-degrading protein